MTNHTALQELQGTNKTSILTNSSISLRGDECPNKISSKKFDGTFVWTKQTQGFILSAYFYGYLATQVFNTTIVISSGDS